MSAVDNHVGLFRPHTHLALEAKFLIRREEVASDMVCSLSFDHTRPSITHPPARCTHSSRRGYTAKMHIDFCFLEA